MRHWLSYQRLFVKQYQVDRCFALPPSLFDKTELFKL